MENNSQETSKKSHKIKKIIHLIFWILILTMVYFGFKYIKNEIAYKAAKSSVATTNEMSNIDAAIYENAIATTNDQNENPDATKSNPQLLGESLDGIKQQIAIDDLQKKYQSLKDELEKVKNQDKVSRLVVAFVDLKNQIDLGQNYQDSLQKFEVLSGADFNLATKANKLKDVLKNNLRTQKEIASEFTKIIPEIIAIKSSGTSSNNFIGKIKNNIGKLVTIRRIDGVVTKSSENIDFTIVEVQKLIEHEKYGEALYLLSALDEQYQQILSKINADLENLDQLNKISEEIYSYLKSSITNKTL